MRLVYITSFPEQSHYVCFSFQCFMGFFLVSPVFFFYFCGSCSQNDVGINIYVLQYAYYYKLIPCEPHERNYALQLGVFKMFKEIL